MAASWDWQWTWQWTWSPDWSTWVWQQVPYYGLQDDNWRGYARPETARLETVHLDRKSVSRSPDAVREEGAWRDPKHMYEDHQVLRCPWPGGRFLYPEFPKPGNWDDLFIEACELGLVQLSDLQHQSIHRKFFFQCINGSDKQDYKKNVFVHFDFIFSPHPVDLSQTEISTGMVYEDTRSKGTETPARWQVPQD